ncbi:hypothetical protein L207DRAFT_557613 [Hyaloscypha variabilis F]|uniref:Zn(2)-C6 fungal-type domain-containing protein n=1 Tax=Hyaloscypha variabilis (strain UAMH 11265 / GT02V1 / F) TaxID=1149755 RepID=A0A2J6R4V3_HYAVF|nr:hypothetical protein L207DRAFT_557613 [Hyaloscypha variabilis F]
MTRGTGERIYRACQRCRERKSKCDLTIIGEIGRPPCLECFRAGHDCNLAGSRRGGDYTHFRKPRREIRRDLNSSINCSQDKEALCSELKNPLDALQILAEAAVVDQDSSSNSDRILFSDHPQAVTQKASQIGTAAAGIEYYELVMNGALERETILNLIQHYLVHYHPFVPLAPKGILSSPHIDAIAAKESFVLTAILTIASKDDPSLDEIHNICWEYMKKLLLDVLLGNPSTQQIGSVEGLLLLSEWVPDIQFDRSPRTGLPRRKIGVSEDSTAWSLVGQAVRQAYLLKLDRTSFREELSGESKDEVDRKRLVWSFVYIADRQISVRMGQSFWSRGPSLSTKFTTSDFPTLQPSSDAEEDYASLLQATIDLTQLLHNAHGILYSSKARTMDMMRVGDYSRYLDDFAKALSAWYQVWDGLGVSPKLRYSLRLMSEYLCLYVNAFSFQSVIYRASTSSKILSPSTLSNRLQNSGLFSSGIMASPDGQFVFESIRSAKAILKEFIDMDATSTLRYMPSRFYLYGIYSAVFLNRADMFGALAMKDERNEIVKLVRGFILALKVAATSESHIGHRYSGLLQSDQSSAEVVQDFTVPDILGTFHDIETSMPAWVEGAGFDPFCGSFSYFDADIFGTLSQRELDFGI